MNIHMSQTSNHRLTIRDHDRDAAGLTYVYPVVSRRAGGVSIGDLTPEQLRALADLEEDRRKGRITEATYQRERRQLLRKR